MVIYLNLGLDLAQVFSPRGLDRLAYLLVYIPLVLYALEKEMAPHSSVLAWRIPGTGEPGGLPSTGSHRAGHD